jgi:hypothetical protein
MNTSVKFIGYFFSHRAHRQISEEMYEQYYESIISFFTYTKENLLFVTDAYTFNKIKDRISNHSNIKIMELRDTDTYKRYYQILSEKFNPEKDSLIENEIITKLIWYFKFELLKIFSDICSESYICYIDSGAFRIFRRTAIDSFINSGLSINQFNDIVLNYKEEYFNAVSFDRLIIHGNYETPCNSMLFSKKIIENLVNRFFIKLDELIEILSPSIKPTQYITIIPPEQRVFTLVLKEMYQETPEIMTLISPNQDAYFVPFHT